MAVFLAGLFVLPPPAMAATTTNWGEVERDKKTGQFQSLEFPVANTATGVNVVWRTEKVTIQFNNYSATFTGGEIGLWGSSPTGAISVTPQQLAERAGTTVDAAEAI